MKLAAGLVQISDYHAYLQQLVNGDRPTGAGYPISRKRFVQYRHRSEAHPDMHYLNPPIHEPLGMGLTGAANDYGAKRPNRID